MSEHNIARTKNLRSKPQSKFVGASVLIAAASFLGTSVGVVAATSPDALTTAAEPLQGAISVDSLRDRPKEVLRVAQKKPVRKMPFVSHQHKGGKKSRNPELNPQPLPPGVKGKAHKE